jgi:hypothetical protein
MTITLFKILRNKARIFITKSYSSYIDKKFFNTDVCAVWCINKNNIAFETPSAFGLVPCSNIVSKTIRKQVGQSIITIVGIPKDNNIPTVLLLPFPSLLWCLGLKLTYKFLKDWKGKSFIGDVSVVQYLIYPK